MSRRFCAALTVLLLSGSAAEGGVFAREVQPLLARRCFSCHGPDEAAGSLRLTTGEALTAETDSGETAIAPGDAEHSELIRRVTSTDELDRMPPEGDPLTEAEVAVLREWIDGGAEYERHWAFEAPTDPQPPAVRQSDWVRNNVDRFILARLEEAGIRPPAEASRRDLARRLYQDLIGLPPTLGQVNAFVADDRPDAYERLVDELLASPHYGERWGRHWLDVVRYAETNSFERDNPKPNAWRYRDYVVQSFNDDKPYDRFLIEQLAGDEVADRSVESLTGTGYLRLGLWDDEPADPLLHRFDQLDDLVSTTSQGMLGLTVGCARCHDHKIDPIPQRDYYEMVAFFRGVTEYATRSDQMDSPLSQMDVTGDDLRGRYASLEEDRADVRRRMREIEQAGISKMSAPDQRATEGRRREKVLREKLGPLLSQEQRTEYEQMRQTAEALSEQIDDLPARTKVLAVSEEEAIPTTHVLGRGNPQSPEEEVAPAFIDLLGGGEAARREVTGSSGRRLALAEWIASPDNGLTARVAANRVWQHHFGRGIVRTPNNFGQLGARPTHPQLLDWLAARLIEGGWRLKPLHRLIVTSAAYRADTAFDAAAADTDPANDLFWCRDVRRMDAEEVRDAVLAAAGHLDLSVGGPSVYPTLPREVLQGQSKPGDGWDVNAGEDANRRSIYIHVKRSLAVPLLTAFDFPDTDSSCEARFKTVQPAQALALLNSDFLNAEARRLAGATSGETPARVAEIFRRVYLREPSADEVHETVDLVERLKAEHGVAPEDALAMAALVAFNSNEFLYVR